MESEQTEWPRKIVIVHEDRPSVLISLAVLASAIEKSAPAGSTIEFIHGDACSPTQRFWEETVDTIVQRGSTIDELHLYGITFSTVDPNLTRGKVEALSRAVVKLNIWSHRWPDGYELTDQIVLLPPWDILHHYSDTLPSGGVRLLRLSLAVTNQVPEYQLQPSEVDLARRLSEAIDREPAVFDQLRQDVAATLRSVAKTFPPVSAMEGRPLHFEVLPRSHKNCVVVQLHTDSKRGEAQLLRSALAIEQPDNRNAIAVGIQELRNGARRLFLFRRSDTRPALPSLHSLVEEFGDRSSMPDVTDWFGREDFLYLEPDKAAACDSGELIRFAESVATRQEGYRRTSPMLSKLLATALRASIVEIDLLKAYSGARSLECRFSDIFELHDRSNRSNDARTTIVARIRARSQLAAVFLLGEDGYNLRRLEARLEGVLLGAASMKSSWLGMIEHVPTRLRLDVTLEDGINRQGIASALSNRARSTRAVSLAEARTAGLLSIDGPISRALESHQVDQIIVYNESETIGPSVPYGLAAAALAQVLGQDRLETQPAMQILDLFSGSGFSAVAMRKLSRDAFIHCVDRMIGADQVQIKNPRTTWLRADAGHALVFEGGFLESNYDLVVMDPPHGLIFDLLFGFGDGPVSLISAVKARSPWLLIYQGHSTQQGRTRVTSDALRDAGYSKRWEVRVGQEIMILATTMSEVNDRLPIKLAAATQELVNDYGWRVAVEPIA